MSIRLRAAGQAEQEALGERFAAACSPGTVVHLHGELGAGKTTFVRGVLRGMGHAGAVRSPTYTLVEPYVLPQGDIYHLDLYRLGDPEELEYLGLRDVLGGESVLLIEWPERGAGWLPDPDIRIEIAYRGEGRELILSAQSARGAKVLGRLSP